MIKARATKWLIAGSLLALCLSIYCLLPVIGPVKIIKDVQYVDGDISKSHRLDVYLPQYRPFWDNSRPLVVWIHGGAWRRGDKLMTAAALLPRCGYVGASVNYRLTDEAKFPAQLEDVTTAIRYMRDHRDVYGIDPDRIGVWGVSAGAHLAALAGLSTEPGLVRAVCDWCGPTDFVTITDQGGSRNKLQLSDPQGPVAQLLGGLPADVPKQAKLASPINYVHAGAPPFLIVHGDADDQVPHQQSIELAKKLTECSVINKLHLLPGGKHEFTRADLIMEVVDFFDKNLKSLK